MFVCISKKRMKKNIETDLFINSIELCTMTRTPRITTVNMKFGVCVCAVDETERVAYQHDTKRHEIWRLSYGLFSVVKDVCRDDDDDDDSDSRKGFANL